MSGSLDKITLKLSELSPEQRQLLQQILDDKQAESTIESHISNYSNPLDFTGKRNQTEELGLSFSQERLWFFEQFHQNSCVYNISRAVTLKGNLNINALERALQTIIQRHESLRTNFQEQNRITIQKIQQNTQFKLAIIDLKQKEQQFNELFERELRKPFNLAEDLMLRASLYCISEQEYIFLIIMHHIASDGWSLGVFTQELNQLYNAFCQHKTPKLPELPLQYADFSLWQRNWYRGEKLESQLNYWRKKFSGNIPILDLPSDRPRPPLETFNGARCPLIISSELTYQLKELSKQLKVTLFMLLLTAFKILLYRYTAEEDIIVGTPIAGRNHLEIEELIGFFVNTLALKSNLAGNPTFEQLLIRVQQTAQEAYIHQELPYEKLIQELDLERDLSRAALTQVLFSFQNTPETSLQLSEIEVSDYGILKTPDNGTARCDLTFFLKEEAGEIRGALEYNTDLFNADRIQRLSEHFKILLAGILQNPQQNISDLPLLTPEEENQLLREWNQTQVDYPQDKCIHQLFETRAATTPDAIAVVLEEQQLTYQQLNQQANQLAHYLQQLGVQLETKVGICIHRSLEMIIGLLGILKAGGTYVPLDPNYPNDRLKFIVEDANLDILLTQKSLSDRLPSRISTILYLDDENLVREQPQINIASKINSNNLAYIIYTSGSTGKPKGVKIPHCNVINVLSSIENHLKVSARDILLSLASFSFDISVAEIFLPLIVGGQLVITTDKIIKDAEQLKQVINQSQATIIDATPATWKLLQTVNWQGNKKLKVISTGEKLSSELAKYLLADNQSVWNIYGPTECTIWSLIYPIKTSEKVLIGKPLANTRTYILDRYLNPVPIGIVGELHIAGHGLARGYLNRSELTAARFIDNPFGEGKLYKTGDLARYLADGNIEFLGRIDNQVKIRGFRIELGEIEAVLREHSAVGETVVTVRENQQQDKYLATYIIANCDRQPEIKELRQFLREKLPEYMIPAAFVFLDNFPLTPNGKIDRRALPEPDFHRNKSQEFIAPRNQTEIKLAEIWQEVLGIENIGIHDNFFDLGGHSLLATQVVSRIRHRFQMDLSLRYLFEFPTVEQLGEYIAKLNYLQHHKPVISHDDFEEIEL